MALLRLSRDPHKPTIGYDDLLERRALLEECFSDHSFERALAPWARYALDWWEDGVLAGSIQVGWEGERHEPIELGWLCVHPDYRGRGIARALVGAALGRLAIYGRPVTVGCSEEMRAFWEGLGWREVGG